MWEESIQIKEWRISAAVATEKRKKKEVEKKHVDFKNMSIASLLKI